MSPWSLTAKRLATASGGGGDTVKLWDSHTGEQLLTLTGHTAGVDSVVFSPGGHLLASAAWDGTIKIWDATPLRNCGWCNQRGDF